ncbi:hypothetical protein Dimus_034100 [Dionaea muscipula]
MVSPKRLITRARARELQEALLGLTRRGRRYPFDTPPPPQTVSSTLFLKSTSNTLTLAHSPTTNFPISSSSTCTSPAVASDNSTTMFTALQHHLLTQNFREADEETRHLLLHLAGEPAKKQGYVFFSEVQFISKEDLIAIDELWRKHSDNRFGYSVQKSIWEKNCDKEFSKLFLRIGWMKKLESSEVEQYNYRSFPNEFTWELNEDTPEGHLPLTNALRGTQLLNSILLHPAFEEYPEHEEDLRAAGGVVSDGQLFNPNLNNGSLFKPNYSF